ncbi:4-nitrophenylphosphatase [Candida viswanathii]|uniref:4-nitrophenylphosphatase n=1 Tax=Candida viswanathii TaxID=5486 RepID=A0A367Y0V9_9ASCO|nr:4-nitrophenylphosphatase [Candida viswanathii]
MTVRTNPVLVSSKEDAEHIISKYDNFLFDIDGVIWLGGELIPGVQKFLDYLTSRSKKYAFVTNSATNSRNEFVSKFNKLGLTGVSKDIIYPTCYSASLELKNLGIPPGSKIWILGDEGIEQEVKEMGYVPLGGNDPLLDKEWDPNNPILQVDPEVKAVIVGSTKKFNYTRIALTIQYLLHNGKSLPFIGTNIDKLYPGPNGMILAAGGSMVQFMAHTTSREFIDVGKPGKQLLDLILQDQGFDKSKTLMVGDTLYTDIKFGNQLHSNDEGSIGNSMLVLSGGTKLKDLEHLLNNRHDYEDPESMIPLFFIESLGALIDLLD